MTGGREKVGIETNRRTYTERQRKGTNETQANRQTSKGKIGIKRQTNRWTETDNHRRKKNKQKTVGQNGQTKEN